MIYQEAQQVSYAWESPDNFAIDSVEIEIIDPAGSPISGVSASATPGTSALAQILISTVFTLALAGIYRVTWTIVLGTRRVKVVEFYVATYISVHDDIRGLMEKSFDDLPNRKIDPELGRVLRILARKYPDAIYASLGVDDQYWYDQALTYLGALRVQRFQMSEKPNGPLKRETQGPVTYEYFQGKGGGPLTDTEENWLGLAWEALAQVSAISSTLQSWRDGFELWGFAGPRRAVEENLINNSYRNPLYAVLLSNERLD